MTAARSRAALHLMLVLCLGYTISQFYRMSVGVISPELSAEIALTAEELGALGGVFFLVFALVQIPAGVLLDRFGPRLINTLLLLIAAAGALIFAAADTGGWLTVGRGVMGLGCATAYMGALVLVSRWFPPDRFAFFAAIVIGTGGVGGLIATTPLALVVAETGWRFAFVGMAAVTVVVAALVWGGVRDAPPGEDFHGGRRESVFKAFKGVGEVFGNRQLLLLLPLNAVAYAVVATVLGLWGAPYLRGVQGLGPVDAADVLMMLAISLMAGSLSYGWIAPRVGTLKRLAIFGAASQCGIMILLALLPAVGEAVLLVLFAALGAVSAYSIILIAHVRALVSRRLVGRGLTVANLFNFGGVGLLQVISGWIIGTFPASDGYPPSEAFTTLFGVFAAIIAVAGAIYLFTREPGPHPSNLSP